MIEIPGYRMLRQLGRGGMATVYLAIQESVDREVALKVMSPALLVDPNFGERFLREARIAAMLHHRHVVGIHDVSHAGDLHYIAMEYIGGGPVLSGIGAPLAPALALRVTREIATALAYAQEKGIVHRDVKPDNILLRDDGSAVLTDFGIARAHESALRMTRTGAIIGTPHYMSPEQARGRAVDGRADLYSLGIVLHEMLVGHVPYRAEDSLAVGIMHITEPVPALPKELVALQGLLDRLLAKEPDDRFQSGHEVAAAITELERMREWTPQPVIGSVSTRSDTPLDGLQPMYALDPAETPSRTLHGRAEPRLGRIEEIAAAADARAMRAERKTPSRSTRSRGGAFAIAALALIVVAAGAAWRYQDALRHLLPRTEFNDTLSRAQQAFDTGKLVGNQGDSARELFLAARAQDPDNDVARRGLDAVAKRLLEQAQQALQRDDLATARSDLEAARDLLGGGSDVDRLAQAIKQRETRGAAQVDMTAQTLDAAAAALAAGRIDGADGAAALYQRVIDGDKGNAIAQAGLRKCADALAAQARAALDSGDVATAAARGDDIARILPSYPGQTDLLGDITRARETARVAQDAKLAALLDRAEASAKAGRLSGADDAALELFREAQRLDPDNARALQGLRRIAQAFLVRANAAIDDDNPGEAEKLVASAARIAPDMPDLRATRINLRELHERLDIDAQHANVTLTQAAQVQRLVADAERAAQAGDLIVPPGDSAFDKYRAALAIDGRSAAARNGLAHLPARAKELFAQALASGAPQRAHNLLEAVRQVAPDDPALPALGDKLANAFLDQADQRIGEGRRDDATRALDAARSLSPGSPRIAPLQARLRAMIDAHG